MKKLIRRILSEIEVPHHYQPTGHSCGPTCLKMVHDFFVGDIFKIPDICEACGTDWVVGTPPDRMAKGLDYMGIKYVEHMMEEDPYQSIKDSIDRGHPCVVRTVTQGVPHWIVVVDYDDNGFKVNDPWLGKIEYDWDEFDSIWYSGRQKIREYFYYEILDGDKTVLPKKKDKSEVTISHFETEEEVRDAIRIALKVFRGQMDPQSLINYILKVADWDTSVKAVYEGNVVGFYFFSEHQLSDAIRYYMVRDYNCYSKRQCDEKYPGSIVIDPVEFDDLEGIEGVALGVNPEYKGLGIGKKLIEYSQNLPYDYVWGQQLESLQNIDHWTKRREIAAYFPGLYLTYRML